MLFSSERLRNTPRNVHISLNLTKIKSIKAANDFSSEVLLNSITRESIFSWIYEISIKRLLDFIRGRAKVYSVQRLENMHIKVQDFIGYSSGAVRLQVKLCNWQRLSPCVEVRMYI